MSFPDLLVPDPCVSEELKNISRQVRKVREGLNIFKNQIDLISWRPLREIFQVLKDLSVLGGADGKALPVF